MIGNRIYTGPRESSLLTSILNQLRVSEVVTAGISDVCVGPWTVGTSKVELIEKQNSNWTVGTAGIINSSIF